MRNVLRTALGFAVGGVAMLALERGARRRGGRAGSAARAFLQAVRPAPVADETVETRVRKKLARTALDPAAITVSIEHGCVDLRGPVETRERARIVRAIATVRGVDSVLDLMTETPALPPRTQGAAIELHRSAAMAPPGSVPPATPAPPWHPATRVVAAGGGLGLAVAALSIGGLLALPGTLLGLFLVTRAAANIPSFVERAADEPHPTF